MNILNYPFSTPYNTAPFSKIEIEQFLPAFIKAIENTKAEIDVIINNSDIPNFKIRLKL